jgi:hypothetical protein
MTSTRGPELFSLLSDILAKDPDMSFPFNLRDEYDFVKEAGPAQIAFNSGSRSKALQLAETPSSLPFYCEQHKLVCML